MEPLVTSGVDWGDLPAWLGAVGTVGAFAAGLTLLRRQLNDFERADEERTAAAASSVSAWWEWDEAAHAIRFLGMGTGGGDRIENRPGWVIRVRNGGRAPIYNCVVFIGPRRVATLPPLGYSFPIVPPESTSKATILSEDEAEIVLQSDDEEYRRTWVEVFFRDAEGRMWRRRHDGVLERSSVIPGPSAPPSYLLDLQ